MTMCFYESVFTSHASIIFNVSMTSHEYFRIVIIAYMTLGLYLYIFISQADSTSQ